MGVAAYNRGSKVISDRLDAEQRPAVFVILESLTTYSQRCDGMRILAPTVARFGDAGVVWLMHRQEGGWREFGYPHRSLWALARTWRLAFVEFGRDEHGRFVRVEPL